MKVINGKNGTAFRILAVNLVLIVCIITVFVLYTARYRNTIRKQNIVDISNINQSAAKISSAFLENQQIRLADAVKYIDNQKFSLSEAVSFLCESNSDRASHYELIGEDSSGYAAACGSEGMKPVD